VRFIANENIAASVIAGLRARGHDILAVREEMRGAPDRLVLDTARSDSRIVLTHDKDFGELAFREGLPVECGVILLRLAGADPAEDVATALNAIDSRDDWAGNFAVITELRVRLRALIPPSKPD
jgi:predicted nuclease of predicted toxin-antitoxin system